MLNLMANEDSLQVLKCEQTRVQECELTGQEKKDWRVHISLSSWGIEDIRILKRTYHSAKTQHLIQNQIP